jgi:hypothetical protein
MDANPPALVLLVALALAGLAGCRRDEVTHFTVAKTDAPKVARAEPEPREEPGGALRWKLPDGWSEAHPGGMRVATLTPPGGGKVDVSVIALPGPAGGELANVNRWRGQLGLGALDDAALAAARITVRAALGPVAVYDFLSDGAQKTRLVAALTTAGGNTWFLKMVGDERPVASARPAFLHLIESLSDDNK